jgi:metallo-beta-lactamase family protein
MRLSFLGAAGTVTGSKYLLDWEDQRILVDCGLFQGLKELRLKNWADFPVDPESIDAVLITHAHIDHTGYLPLLVKKGFKGPIYCTPATFDLAKILLPDSGSLQEEDAKRANKYHYSKHEPALALYTEEDAIKCLNQFKIIDFNQPLTLFPQIIATWRHAGHILGAASILVESKDQNILFSGDLGRYVDPLLNPPAPPPNCDTLILESTYGDRLHSKEDTLALLSQIINSCLKKNGSILIPAFAVGRTQSIMYYLDQLIREGRIPKIPMFLDSPMAINASKIMQNYLDEEHISAEDCNRICKQITYVNTPDESKTLDIDQSSKIIISASGMLSGGRILHHLKYYGPHPNNTILLTGYQAQGTRGARLLNHETHLKIHGEMVPIRAQVAALQTTSAHADYQEILKWIKSMKQAPKQIFITHGEPDSALALAEKIKNQLRAKVTIPRHLQTYILKK